MLRISEAISALADDPRPEGNEKLEGTDDGFRIRIGDYRVIYRVDDKERQVKVTDVLPRKDAYRKF
jgi:mRNA interferase RelE/StbE